MNSQCQLLVINVEFEYLHPVVMQFYFVGISITRSSSLSCEYLREFSKKIEITLVELSGPEVEITEKKNP
jgi:hypothetical protein